MQGLEKTGSNKLDWFFPDYAFFCLAFQCIKVQHSSTYKEVIKETGDYRKAHISLHAAKPQSHSYRWIELEVAEWRKAWKVLVLWRDPFKYSSVFFPKVMFLRVHLRLKVKKWCYCHSLFSYLSHVPELPQPPSSLHARPPERLWDGADWLNHCWFPALHQAIEVNAIPEFCKKETLSRTGLRLVLLNLFVKTRRKISSCLLLGNSNQLLLFPSYSDISISNETMKAGF